MFTDAIVIVLSITFLELIVEAKKMVLTEVAKSIASTFSIGVVFGLVSGVVWLKLLSMEREETYDDVLTLSMAILFYGVTEYIGGNGAIFALVFGLVLGNAREVGGILRMEGIVEVGAIMRKFMSQMSFFIRTYFFVYLGLIMFIENPTIVAYSIAISLLLIFGRFIGVNLIAWKDPELQKFTGDITLMMPRGLAAAIMAQLVVSSGIQFSSAFPEIIMIVIILSVIIGSVGGIILSRKRGSSDDPANS